MPVSSEPDCCSRLFQLVTDRRWVRIIIASFLLIVSGCLIALLSSNQSTQWHVSVYLLMISALISCLWSGFLFFQYTFQRSRLNRPPSRLQRSDDLCSPAMWHFCMDLLSGVLVSLFAIMTFQHSPCRDLERSFSPGACPLYNTGIAFGFMAIPCYLSLVILDIGTCCCGWTVNEPERQQAAATGSNTDVGGEAGKSKSKWPSQASQIQEQQPQTEISMNSPIAKSDGFKPGNPFGSTEAINAGSSSMETSPSNTKSTPALPARDVERGTMKRKPVWPPPSDDTA